METESHIQDSLHSIGERTVFIIAHRISSIRDADLILVMDNGRILESGTHEQLLEKKGYYYTVFSHQYGEFDKIRAQKLQAQKLKAEQTGKGESGHGTK